MSEQNLVVDEKTDIMYNLRYKIAISAINFIDDPSALNLTKLSYDVRVYKAHEEELWRQHENQSGIRK
jgi:hypothetical protein